MIKLERLPESVKVNAPRIARDLWIKGHMLETLIAQTPTSEQRNALCDANIHIKAAIAELAKVRT